MNSTAKPPLLLAQTPIEPLPTGLDLPGPCTPFAEFLQQPVQARWPIAWVFVCGRQWQSDVDVRRCLARLSQLQAQVTYAVLDDASCRDSLDFFLSLGFRQLNLPNGHPAYVFSLYDYQIPKDWLNAKHWAHPERWDRRRW